MMPEKFIEFAKQFEDDESVFGFFYREIDNVDTLAVNGGYRMDEETYGPINDWCGSHGVDVWYEAECDDDYFLEKGYEKIENKES